MDSNFTDACQGLGVALAAGCLFGSIAFGGVRRYALGAIAAIAGAVLAVLTGPPVWLGVAEGILAAILAFTVASGVASGAARRAGEAGGGTVSTLLAAVALVLAVVSLLVPPIALVALVAIVFLAVARRRRAARKYAGLRILR